MSLIIKSPIGYENEREYIYNVILNNFLGLKCQVIYEERKDIEISMDTCKNKLFVADVFFKTPKEDWLKPPSLPQVPLQKFIVNNKLKDYIPLINVKVPIIYGTETEIGNYITNSGEDIYLGIDIFGSAFFMLTRYEEFIIPNRDLHGRFMATSSLAYHENFLDRPIINEYTEIFWYCLKKLHSGMERKKREFRTLVSHDVDVPFLHANSNISQLIRTCGGDILKRKSPELAFRQVKSWFSVKLGHYRNDINFTFDRIMNISENKGLKNAFYFKTGCTDPTYDDAYSIEHPWLRELIKDIYRRGHEIGIHPSYNTFKDSKETKLEFDRLLKVCEEEGINQNKWGGRQHYLRWSVPITWQNWSNAGIDYDSTLCYADHAGFRCGVCYEFPVFDIGLGKKINLIERPLIVMEASIFEAKYMGLKGNEALEYMLQLKEHCRLFSGDFTLLWHNSSFIQPSYWDLYSELL